MMPINSPMEIIAAIKNGQNPQQLLMNILEGRMGQTPMGKNLLALAKNNDTKGIETVVRNLFNSRGVDFDKEFSAFKRMLGVK